MSCGYAFAADTTTYPDHPVKMLVGLMPGGPSDLYARVMARSPSQASGPQFIVENSAGTSGGIAAAAEYAQYIGDESRRWEKFLAKNRSVMENRT
ncbi:MAG: hypothetical protein ABIH03_09595 [Pseudomonadota bacterium]